MTHIEEKERGLLLYIAKGMYVSYLHQNEHSEQIIC